MTAESADNVRASLLEMKTLYSQLDEKFQEANRSPGINREWLEDRYFYLQKIVGRELNEAIRAYKAKAFRDASDKLVFVRERLGIIQSQLTAFLQPVTSSTTARPVDATFVPGFYEETPRHLQAPSTRLPVDQPPPRRSSDHRIGRRKRKAPSTISRILRKIKNAKARKAAKPRHHSH